MTRAVIILGYGVFVFLPMTATVWFYLYLEKTEGSKVEEPVEHTSLTVRGTPETVVPRKVPQPQRNMTRPGPVETVKPKPSSGQGGGSAAPTARPVFVLPSPRDLGAELEEIVTATRSPDAVTRSRSIKTLATFLGRKDILLRRRAAETLAGTAADAGPSLAALREAENDTDDEVRRLARLALDRWETAGRKAREVEVLVKDLEAKEPEDRVKALLKIAAFGADGIPASRAIVEKLRDREKAVQDAAVKALEAVDPNAETITLCVLGLQARDPKTRVKTLEQIGSLGVKGKAASEYLAAAVLDKGDGVQAAALHALERVNPSLYPPVAAIARGAPGDRRRALVTLAELGSDAENAVPLLLACHDRPKLWGTEPHFDLFPTIAQIAPNNRQFATAVLAAVGAPNPKTDATLTARRLAGLAQLEVVAVPLEDKIVALQAAAGDGHTLAQVFKAWARLAPSDRRFVDTVLSCVSDPKSPSHRVAAGLSAITLVDTTADRKTAALHAALDRGHFGPRVFEAFGEIAPKDKRFAGAVLAAIAVPNPDHDPAARANRAGGLAYLDLIDATHGAKVDALVQAMSDGDAVALVFAALGRLAPGDKRFTAVVLDAVAARNPDAILSVRERRLAALTQLDVVNVPLREKVSALVAGLNDKSTLLSVIKALEGYGGQARSALPALKELKGATNEAVRSAAITAIANIEAASGGK